MPETFGPGPEERKLRSRLHFWWFRHWPDAVVRERLNDPRWDEWPHAPASGQTQEAPDA